MGFQRAPPTAAMGARPRTVVADVSRIGRKRFREAVTMASRNSACERSISIWSMRTIALLIMISARLMMPSVPKNDSGCPVANSPVRDADEY